MPCPCRPLNLGSRGVPSDGPSYRDTRLEVANATRQQEGKRLCRARGGPEYTKGILQHLAALPGDIARNTFFLLARNT